MKTYIPGSYNLIALDENFKMSKESWSINSMIDYIYYIHEDGRMNVNNELKEVKEGDVIIYLYGTDKDNAQQTVILEDGAYKDYIVRNYFEDKRKEESQNIDGCDNCVKCSDPC